MRPEAEAFPHLTHGRVLKIAVPIVLSNATTPVLGLVDTGVVGQIDAAAPIAAVGLGAIIITTIYWVFGFLRMGTVGLAAQAIGRRDTGETAAILTRVLLIAAAAGLGLIVLQVPVFALALWAAQGSAEAESLARGYLAIRIWSAPAAIAVYGVTGWLIAQERTGAVFAIQLWMNLLNIALDLWFVLGLGWGVRGVAVASLLAEWSGLLMGLWLCRAAFAVPAWRDWARVFDLARLRRLAQVGSDILIRSVLLMAAFTSFMFLGGRFGDATHAANQVLLQFVYVTAHAMDGFAFAAETLAGQALGARSRPAFRRAGVLVAGWSVGIGLALAAAFALAGPAIVDLMAQNAAVRTEARLYLGWMVAVPILGAAAWILDGIFIGATATRDMRNMMVLSIAVYAVLLAALMPVLGNHGMWAALLGMFVARGATLGARYPALERSVGGADVRG